MNLNQFKSWKLLYEDNDICFSKAVYNMDQSNVFFITFFTPENMSIATRHLLEGHLHNFVALIEEDDKLHLILKSQEGHPIKKFITKTPLEYDDRVQIVYEYFKLIEKYDAFPNAVKIQLLDEEQLLISDDGLAFRELIDYMPVHNYSEREVFKQLGKTIDLILHDAEGYHSQFIDNLLLGNHHFTNLHASKENFKDIFIFEKPDALESINYEYTIIINDLEAGPPLQLTEKDLKQYKAMDHIHIAPNSYDAHVPHDELQRELAELLATKSSNSTGQVEDLYWDDAVQTEDSTEPDATISQTIVAASMGDGEAGSLEDTSTSDDSDSSEASDSSDVSDSSDASDDSDTSIEEKPIHDFEKSSLEETIEETPSNATDLDDDIQLAPQKTIATESSPVDSLFTATNDLPSPTAHTLDTKSFKSQFIEDDKMPEVLPKSGKQRFVEENEENVFDEDMAELFDVSDTPEYVPTRRLWILVAVGVLLVLIVGFWGLKSVFASEPIVASFDIEALHDNRIAFMNTSTGEKRIEHYSWEIYYADTLVQTFTDENLFPVFDTEGTYKIVLKVQDKKGVWSEPYTELYDFTLETPQTTTQTTTTP